MPGRYLTETELKTYMRSELTTDDASYLAAILTAEAIIDNACGRRFDVATSSSARSYIASGGVLQFIHDCTTITSVVENGATLTTAVDYQPEPLNNLWASGETVPFCVLRRLSYYGRKWYNMYGIPGQATIVVTAAWGWQAIPAQVKESAKIIAKDVYLNRDTTGFGLVAITDAGGIGTRENRVVQEMVTNYQHPARLVIG